jgi:hypothetical protein
MRYIFVELKTLCNGYVVVGNFLLLLVWVMPLLEVRGFKEKISLDAEWMDESDYVLWTKAGEKFRPFSQKVKI